MTDSPRPPLCVQIVRESRGSDNNATLNLYVRSDGSLSPGNATLLVLDEPHATARMAVSAKHRITVRSSNDVILFRGSVEELVLTLQSHRNLLTVIGDALKNRRDS
jgi:hypothetical protein